MHTHTNMHIHKCKCALTHLYVPAKLPLMEGSVLQSSEGHDRQQDYVHKLPVLEW